MSLLDNPAHWRTRAVDVRRLADAALDLAYRAKLQKIAASYDLLALRAAARLGSGVVLGMRAERPRASAWPERAPSARGSAD